MVITKAEIARRQLGAALHLYLEDRDPISVHCLACGGGELAEALAAKAGKPIFRSLRLASDPEMLDGAFTALRNQYWNALKHANTKKGAERNDDELLASFTEHENEIRLFIGWTDYATAVGQWPIAAQVFQSWFLALDPSKFSNDEEVQLYRRNLETIFPNLLNLSQARRKRRLRRAIEKALKTKSILESDVTDHRPLLLGDL